MEILNLLKADLEKRNSIGDDYLEHLIEVARTRIEAEGITLGDTDDDKQLIEMYAAYLYRKRVGSADGYNTAALNPQGMPYMLRLALNDRVIAEKMS